MKTATNAPLGKDVIGLAGLFLTSGTMHFVKPEPFEAMVPKQLPSRRALVYASGVAELAFGLRILWRRGRRAGSRRAR